jgi:hypothetical protein
VRWEAKQGIFVARRRDGWIIKVNWWPGGEMGGKARYIGGQEERWVAKQGILVARRRDG